MDEPYPGRAQLDSSGKAYMYSPSLLQLMSDRDTFRDLELPRVIDTADTEFVSEFYTPLLSRAVSYDRGVGFFSSSWIESAARGMANLAENGGVARWITSPILGEDDWRRLNREWKPRRMRY